MISGDDGSHYTPYAEVKASQVTSEDHRPSLAETKKKKKESVATKRGDQGTSKTSATTAPEKNDCALSAQTARAAVTCVECRKPRIVYCKIKLDFRHKVMLARTVSSFEYSCGSELFPPGEKRKLAKSMTVRPNLSCADQIEVPYYGDNDIGRKDLCSHCGDSNSAKAEALKQQFKTVLPMCKSCGEMGKQPFTQRPYGKNK